MMYSVRSGRKCFNDFCSPPMLQLYRVAYG